MLYTYCAGAEWLECSPLVPQIEDSLCGGGEFSITPSVHPAGKGYLALFRAGEGEDEEWHPHLSYTGAGTSWLS